MELENKILLLTGASTGIGKLIAQSFLILGAKVIVFGLHEPEFSSQFYKVDITKENEIILALSKIKKIDILINNAGVAKISSVVETSNEIFDEMFNVNVRGLFWMSKHSSPKFNENGCIINISSLAGLKALRGFGVYGATKSAVISLTKILALELANQKIRVNSIAPGIVDTGIWDKICGEEGRQLFKNKEKHVLLKRAGKPSEIAETAIFLCQNDYITGETILVDGGESLQ
ncbi:MAG: SDR family oxidoreductase [Candidatus Margulisiibacteriota bacterium]|jgi:3-oxoacyl-[acyl-carrier protein] reductase